MEGWRICVEGVGPLRQAIARTKVNVDSRGKGAIRDWFQNVRRGLAGLVRRGAVQLRRDESLIWNLRPCETMYRHMDNRKDVLALRFSCHPIQPFPLFSSSFVSSSASSSQSQLSSCNISYIFFVLLLDRSVIRFTTLSLTRFISGASPLKPSTCRAFCQSSLRLPSSGPFTRWPRLNERD